MSKLLTLIYAAIAYVIFLATFLYLIAFVGDFPIVPRTVDRGPEAPAFLALVVNIGLIALFGVQHSVMARQGFKAWWTRIVPKPAERSTFVAITSMVLIALFVLWRPIGGTVWNVEANFGQMLLWALFALGWTTVLVSTFLINHFELFGLQQAWFHARGREAAAPTMRTPMLYKLVRHPLYTGFFLAFWATPHMTVGHLVLALGMSAYMLIAIGYEERDLIGMFGRDYEDYRGRVGMLIPRLSRRS